MHANADISRVRAYINRVWQERRSTHRYERCVHVLMFINCPCRQRNYFVNHPRGKMMIGTLCQLSSRYSRLHNGHADPVVVLDHRSLYSHGLLVGSRGVVSIKHHQLLLFRFTCETRWTPFIFFPCNPRHAFLYRRLVRASSCSMKFSLEIVSSILIDNLDLIVW